MTTPSVPTTAEAAAEHFACPILSCSLSGRACAQRFNKAPGASHLTACRGCPAGAARVELIGVEPVMRRPVYRTRPNGLADVPPAPGGMRRWR